LTLKIEQADNVLQYLATFPMSRTWKALPDAEASLIDRASPTAGNAAKP